MGTTTVRLDADDEALLDLLAPEYGGRSSVIRYAIRTLAAERKRQDGLALFLEAWDADDGPIPEDEIASMAERFGL